MSEVSINTGEVPCIATASVFAVDSSGSPTGDPLTPDAPFEFFVDDPTLVTMSRIGDNQVSVQGNKPGTASLYAQASVGGVAAATRVGHVIVHSAPSGGFVTTIDFGFASI